MINPKLNGEHHFHYTILASKKTNQANQTIMKNQFYLTRISTLLNRWLTFVFILILSSFITTGARATVLVDPATSGGFEAGTTFAANGWSVANFTSNQWFVGINPTGLP